MESIPSHFGFQEEAEEVFGSFSSPSDSLPPQQQQHKKKRTTKQQNSEWRQRRRKRSKERERERAPSADRSHLCATVRPEEELEDEEFVLSEPFYSREPFRNLWATTLCAPPLVIRFISRGHQHDHFTWAFTSLFWRRGIHGSGVSSRAEHSKYVVVREEPPTDSSST